MYTCRDNPILRVPGANSVRRRLPQGIAAAGVIAATAWRARALTKDGALAATAVGALVLAGAGVRGSAALVSYFASSSLLGRLPASSAQQQRRGNRRDAVQVLANGGPAATLALALAVASGRQQRIAEAAFYSSIAAAAADTWATEIGTRWGGQPRVLLLGPQAPAGTSGGVSGAGLAASCAAAASIALLAAAPNQGRGLGAAVLIGGVSGSLADSVIGATVQERRWCDACLLATESPRHSCGTETRHIGGIPGCTNDIVNVLGILVGATAGAITAARLDS
ncbi:MAG: DUF92 domain-containing protein [Thermomicrobiales bacterium]